MTTIIGNGVAPGKRDCLHLMERIPRIQIKESISSKEKYMQGRGQIGLEKKTKRRTKGDRIKTGL